MAGDIRPKFKTGDVFTKGQNPDEKIMIMTYKYKLGLDDEPCGIIYLVTDILEYEIEKPNRWEIGEEDLMQRYIPQTTWDQSNRFDSIIEL